MDTNQKIMSKKDAIKLSEQMTSELPLIELHILHTVSGALLNRDFNNRQKVLNYGGTLRGRFSSASVLHNIRLDMETEQDTHTRFLPELIKKSLEEGKTDDNAYDVELKIIEDLFPQKKDKKSKDDKDNNSEDIRIASTLMTDQILDVDRHTLKRYAEEIENAAELVLNKKAKIEEVTKTIQKNMTASSTDRPLSDVTALFGRMSADQTFSTVYSPIMVSHAFTIDAYKNNFDDYIASDDYLIKSGFVLTDDDGRGKNAGAAYMDTSDISANTYYRCGIISQRLLFQNLCIGKPFSAVDDIKEKTYKLTAYFAKHFIGALPTAMQTRKFTRTVPDAVYIDKAPDTQGISAANIYENAVYASKDKSICDIGVDRLKKFMQDSVQGCFVERELTGQYWMSDKYAAPEGISTISYKDLETIVRP